MHPCALDKSSLSIGRVKRSEKEITAFDCNWGGGIIDPPKPFLNQLLLITCLSGEQREDVPWMEELWPVDWLLNPVAGPRC